MNLQFNIQKETVLADLITPVQLYLKLRDIYPNALLLESSDYHSKTDANSFICLNPIATFKVTNGLVNEIYANGENKEYTLNGQDLTEKFKAFTHQFKIENADNLVINGLFGYVAWDAIPHFETVQFSAKGNEATIPEFCYSFYQNIIVFNHFHNEIQFIEYQNNETSSQFSEIKNIVHNKAIVEYPFNVESEIESNLTDEEFKEIVSKCKQSCFRGDVFQIVPSRQFKQKFSGDEFNVYRILRSVNPSPYLFYFDYGNYKIFGSSPEAQIIINNNHAEIHPIAGTVRRTGSPKLDKELTEQLIADPKENEEHVMLVDLARNDLSRNSENVTVDQYKEIQYFSHVIHMVSKVTAQLDSKINTMKVFADSFPAGTLSGAPKFKAMELLDSYENQNRGVYGGGIGYIGFNGDINMAIAIRTFVSKQNTLFFQAGAGVVSKSVEENELQEVNHKLGALRRSIEIAQNL
ncbi:anthranilate synthase component I family protein [Chishuiella sp.]|uniref:anthranilate synthase component I family protein n=1 Tax=Chishuiella sp. TaxID=1969467 RepID=UPI0028B24B7F|nr:chorismate-binding protein [Chishuiella sp.]